MKNILIAGLTVIVIGTGAYFLLQDPQDGSEKEGDQRQEGAITAVEEQQLEERQEAVDETKTVIGTSVKGNDITAHHYGTGDTELLFIGGIHGGYSWNTALVAYELMEHLESNEQTIPENVRVTVIPVLNPDGLETVVGTTSTFRASDVPSDESETVPGRFNANGVDLNRNFDCDWKRESAWQNQTVSGGTEAFSEPESKAILEYVGQNEPDAVVAWYSAAGGVFASNCHGDLLPETREITQVYANASGYKAFEEFDFYEITGDMVNWFAREGIPAISVLLTTHNDVEWSKNRAGIEALFEHYSE